MSSRLVFANTSWKARYELFRWGSNILASSLKTRVATLGLFRYSSSPGVLNPSPYRQSTLKIIPATYLEETLHLILIVGPVEVEVLQKAHISAWLLL